MSTDQLRLISTAFLLASLVSCAGVATDHSPRLLILSAICWTGCLVSGFAAGIVKQLSERDAEPAPIPPADPEGPAPPLPVTLMAYATVTVFTLGLQAGLNGIDENLAVAGALQLVATGLLVYGLQPAWHFLVGVTLVAILVRFFAGDDAWLLGLTAIQLALLLAPPTRHYPQRQRFELPAR
jgi:hypothetical protein